MAKLLGTLNKKTYHRKDFSGLKNSKRIVCKNCFSKHYEQRYHYCEFKPRLLDLYCGGGGASLGYYAGGFNVTGVDLSSHKNYFGEFIQGDAIEYLNEFGGSFDFIHASPPCQEYSTATKYLRNQGKEYPDLVAATRDALIKTGKPFVIENVIGAPLRRDLILRGEMFGLKVIRRRIFEFGNFEPDIVAPGFIPASVKDGSAVIVFGSASWHATGRGEKRVKVIPDWKLDTIRNTWSFAMGIGNYMNEKEIAQSIPPAYTHFIATSILAQKLIKY